MTPKKLNHTRNTLSDNIRGQSVALLHEGMIACIDLSRHCKQAHWNVKGMSFIGLHELFDVVYNEAIEFADLCAERLVALGGVANGTVQTLAKETTLPPYPLTIKAGEDHVKALADSLAACGHIAREAIDKADDFGDVDTSDLFTQVSRGLDQRLWMVEAHVEA